MYNMLEKYGCEAEVVDYVPAKYGMWRSFYKGKEHRYPLLLAVLAFIYKFPIRYYQRRVFRKFVIKQKISIHFAVKAISTKCGFIYSG